MIPAAVRKVLADLGGNKIRSALAIMTIAVGIFAVGFIAYIGHISMTDMDADFMGANAHSAILYTSSFTEDLLPTLRRVPGVAEVEGRSSLDARVVVNPDRMQSIQVEAIPPVDELLIDKLSPVDPPSMPALQNRQILLADSARSVIPVKTGDRITLELTGGQRRDLTVIGFVHDVYAIPPTFGGSAIGYVNPATVEWLGGSREFNQVYLTVSEKRTDNVHVTAVARAVADKVEEGGRVVGFTFIYNPGRHFAKDIFTAVTAILSILGVLSVFLSTFLVINIINALLSQHIRFIGVMKACGGRRGQIVAMYLSLVLCFGILAFLLTSWSAALAGYQVSSFLGNMLNFTVRPFRVSTLALVFQAAIALFVPLLAALPTILNGTRITVREAIGGYGLAQGSFHQGRITILLEKLAFLSRPTLISLRNTFRRKTRLVLTLFTLTLGGAIFIAVCNLAAAFDTSLTDAQKYFMANVTVNFGQFYRFNRISALVENVPGVSSVEGWDLQSGELLAPGGQSSLNITIFAPPNDSTLIDPVITSGRWLLPGDENAIVIGNHVTRQFPDLKVGDDLVIKTNDIEHTWRIVGIYRLVGNSNPPVVYVNRGYISGLLHRTGQVSSIRIITAQKDAATETRIAKSLETIFKENGIQVSDIRQGNIWRKQQGSTINILIIFLLVMSTLIALVGGLGLMGTMSMNVLERSREIGVLRAVGASNGAILRLVLVEVLLIGFISWVLGLVFSIPVTYLLDTQVGRAIMTMPLDFQIGPAGLVYWLGIVLVISILAAALPAANAIRLTVREVLAYE